MLLKLLTAIGKPDLWTLKLSYIAKHKTRFLKIKLNVGRTGWNWETPPLSLFIALYYNPDTHPESGCHYYLIGVKLCDILISWGSMVQLILDMITCSPF